MNVSPGSELVQVLEIDRQNRRLYNYREYSDTKNNDNLFNINSLEFGKNWLYELPTITGSETTEFAIKTSKEFREYFRKTYKLFKSVNFDHILIAGGSITDIMCNKPVNDFDLFVYGIESTEDANNLVYDTVRGMIEDYKKYHPGDRQRVRVTNAENSLTLQLGSVKIQIIYRLYHNKSEILHGFDFGGCALGYDGVHVRTTRLGKFACEYKANVVDLSRRSTTFESRLLKYLQKKDFKIIMLEFDMFVPDFTALKYGLVSVIELPYLSFGVRKTSHNRMEYEPVTVSKTELKSDSKSQLDKSDYESGQTNRHIIKMSPGVDTSYALFMDHYKNKYCITDIRFMTGDVLTDCVIDFRYLTQTQKSSLVRFVNNMCIRKPTWRTDNPGSQLTGSFNPIIRNSADWYGKYLVDQDEPEPESNHSQIYTILTVILIAFIVIMLSIMFHQ